MKLALVGDVMLGRLVNQALQTSDSAYPWGDTLSVLKGADVRLCNLECVLSDVGRPWNATPKMFHFRSDEKNVQVLQTAQINVVSLANNHVLDYEDDALARTIHVLDLAAIQHSGAGKNIAEALQPAIFRVKDETLGLVAFTDNEPGWEGREHQPGVRFVPVDVRDLRAQQLFSQIQQLRHTVDFLIVSAHWGPNWGYEPPHAQLSFAHALVEAGADLVFGHSGHIVRGVEIYRGRPILYCAGDFIDDYAVDEVERNDESLIFVLDVDRVNGWQLRLYPTEIRRCQARLATSPRKEAIMSKFQTLCHELGTAVALESDCAVVNIL